MHTDDEELIALFKRLGVGILVLLLFSTIFIVFIYNKFLPHTSEVITKINNNESLYVLVDDNSCKTCKRIKEVLKENNVKYYEINIDKDKQYKEFLQALSITENEIVVPTLMYVNNGSLDSTIVEIKDEEILNAFLENTKEE